MPKGRKYTPNTDPSKTRSINIEVSSEVDKMTASLLAFHGVDKSGLYEMLVEREYKSMQRNKKVVLAKRKAELMKQLAAVEAELKS